MDIKLQKKPWYIRYRYHIMAGAAILALVVYSICFAFAPQQMLIKEQNIIVDTARNDKFHEYVDVEGIVQPIMTIKINTLEGGTVERIMAEDGTMLHKGDTILIISNPDLLHDIDDGSGSQKYCVCHVDDTRHCMGHVHITCQECHHTFCLTNVKIPPVALPEGFMPIETEYIVKGICSECAKRK